MVVVEHGLHLNLCGVREYLVTIEAVLIDGDIAVECQLEDISKQVDLLIHRLYGVVESTIGILVEVYLAVDITAPHDVLWHIDSRGEHQSGTHRHALVLRLSTCLLLCLLLATCLGLSHCASSHQRYHQ